MTKRLESPNAHYKFPILILISVIWLYHGSNIMQNLIFRFNLWCRSEEVGPAGRPEVDTWGGSVYHLLWCSFRAWPLAPPETGALKPGTKSMTKTNKIPHTKNNNCPLWDNYSLKKNEFNWIWLKLNWKPKYTDNLGLPNVGRRISANSKTSILSLEKWFRHSLKSVYKPMGKATLSAHRQKIASFDGQFPRTSVCRLDNVR